MQNVLVPIFLGIVPGVCFYVGLLDLFIAARCSWPKLQTTFGVLSFLFGVLALFFLMDLDRLKEVYLIEISSIPLLVSIGLQLSNQVIQARVVKQQLLESESRWRQLLENVNLFVVELNSQGKVKYVNPYYTQLTGFQSQEVLGENWFEKFIPHSERVNIEQVFRGFLLDCTPTNYQNPIIKKAGGQLQVAWSNVLTRDRAGNVTGTISIGANITQRLQVEVELETHRRYLEDLVEQRTAELTQANATLQQQQEILERRYKIATGLTSIVAALNSERSLPEIFSEILSQTNPILETKGSAIYRYNPDKANFTCIAAVGCLSSQLKRQVNHDHPYFQALKQIITTRQITSFSLQPPEGAHEYSQISKQIVVPLIIKNNREGDTYGGIVLHYCQSHTFSALEQQLANAFSHQVALAVENSRLKAAAEKAAVAAERSRLGRELHDSVTQSLYCINTTAEFLPILWERHPETAKTKLAELQQSTKGALKEMRTLLMELQPTALLEFTIGTLLEQLAETVMSQTEVKIETKIQGDLFLPDNVQVSFYRIAQECLNNIVKHSRATEATIFFSCQPQQVVLQIQDNGCGFDDRTKKINSLGLRIIQERAKMIGASVTIDSQPGEGSQIKVVWLANE